MTYEVMYFISDEFNKATSVKRIIYHSKDTSMDLQEYNKIYVNVKENFVISGKRSDKTDVEIFRKNSFGSYKYSFIRNDEDESLPKRVLIFEFEDKSKLMLAIEY